MDLLVRGVQKLGIRCPKQVNYDNFCLQQPTYFVKLDNNLKLWIKMSIFYMLYMSKYNLMLCRFNKFLEMFIYYWSNHLKKSLFPASFSKWLIVFFTVYRYICHRFCNQWSIYHISIRALVMHFQYLKKGNDPIDFLKKLMSEYYTPIKL